MKSEKPMADNMDLDCPLAGMVTSAIKVISKPTIVTESTRDVACKVLNHCESDKSTDWMNTAIQVVLDEIVLVHFFNDAN